MKESIVWIDTEFSGTSPESDELLEVAALITDLKGNIISEPYHSLVSVTNISSIISKSVDKVKIMHEKSGLWSDLWNKKSKTTEIIDKEMVRWLETNCEEKTILYFGGNSVTTDRNFIASNLPKFYSMISFRSIDATTLSIVLSANSGFPKYFKNPKHRALDDVKESILEYQHYTRWITMFSLSPVLIDEK